MPSSKAKLILTRPDLVQRGPNIWTAEGTLPFGFVQVPARMVVLGYEPAASPANKRSKNAVKQQLHLLVVSPFPPTVELKAQLDALGAVKLILAPAVMHHLWAGDMQQAYPEAKLLGPPALASKRPDLHFDVLVSDGAPADVAGSQDIRLQLLKEFQEVVVLHQPSRTLVLCDCAFNLEPGGEVPLPGFPVSLYLRLTGGYRRCCVTTPFKFFIKDAAAAQAELEAVVSNWDFDQIVMAHGTVIQSGGKQALREGTIAWLGDLVVQRSQHQATNTPLLLLSAASLAGVAAAALVLQRYTQA